MNDDARRLLVLAFVTLLTPAHAMAQLSTTRTTTTSTTGTSTCSGDKVQLTGFTLSPSNPLLYQNVTVTVSMKNICGTTLNIPYNVSDGSTIVKAATTSVAANQTVSVQFAWLAAEGSHAFDAYLDPGQTLGEPATATANNGAASPVTFAVEGWNAWTAKAKVGIRNAVHDAFKLTFVNGVIIGSIAVSVASGGTLSGPDILPIAKQAISAAGVPIAAADAMAGGFAEGYKAWATSVRLPSQGLPWYPTFVLVSANPAPPTANTPTTMAALSQATITSAQFSQFIRNRLPANALASGAGPAVDALAAWAADCLAGLKQSPLKNVIATGPVPLFVAPAWTPGPVVGGSATGAPGHITPNFC